MIFDDVREEQRLAYNEHLLGRIFYKELPYMTEPTAMVEVQLWHGTDVAFAEMELNEAEFSAIERLAKQIGGVKGAFHVRMIEL